MKLLRSILLLPFATTLAFAQPTPPSEPANVRNQPTAVVISLYSKVVSRHLHDVPQGAAMKSFAPYFSQALLHKMDDAHACSADWDRTNPEPHVKATMTAAFDIFSGDSWDTEPRVFHIQKVRSEPNGSKRIDVRLTGNSRYEKGWSWRVAVVVFHEDGRYVIDDVIYINDSTWDNPKDKPPDHTLSEYLSAGCNGPHWAGYSLPTQPAELVRSLYQLVVARAPGGIPSGADWKIFSAYMSKTMLHRIDDFNACSADWSSRPQDPKYPVKAPFGVYESGIFSGDDEKTSPRSFQIEKTQIQQDGSIRVDVKLAWWEFRTGETHNADKPWVWHVADVLVRENGRLVVGDVIYLKDETRAGDVDYPLSKALSQGCDGPRWIGYQNLPQ